MSRPQLRWLGRLLLLAGVLVFVLAPGIAGAQDDNYPVSSTSTTRQCEHGNSNAEVCGTVVTVPSGRSTSLPFTGGNAALLTVVGLVVLAAGGSLVWFGRRSDSTA